MQAFVTVRDGTAARAAVSALNGQLLGGNRILVKLDAPAPAGTGIQHSPFVMTCILVTSSLVVSYNHLLWVAVFARFVVALCALAPLRLLTLAGAQTYPCSPCGCGTIPEPQPRILGEGGWSAAVSHRAQGHGTVHHKADYAA
jgi:hypothetical protein